MNEKTAQSNKDDASSDNSRARSASNAKSKSTQPAPTKLISVDDTIDGIAREALAEARRVEETEKYRKSPRPLIPPDPSVRPPK